jgi:chromosome segregation ATPase
MKGITSGFCLLNRRKHQEVVARETELRQLQAKHLHRIQELEVERDLTAGGIAQLREQSDQSSSELAANRQKVDNLEEQIANQKKKLQSKRVKLREAADALKSSQLEMNTLSLQATQHEQEANLSTQKSERLRTRVQSLKQLDAERQNMQRKCDQLEQKVKELGGQLVELRQELETAAERTKKERTRRKETEKLLTESSERVNELAVQFDHERVKREEIEKETKRLEGLLTKKNDEEAKAAETILALNRQVTTLTAQKNECEQENLGIRQTLERQSQRITELRKDRKDLAALTQLIHRITDGRADSIQILEAMTATYQ